MNWFCCTKQHIRKIYPQFSYNWYVQNENPHDQKAEYHEKIKRCDATKNPYQNESYARIKIKSKNLQDIYMDLRQNRSNFVDLDFPHVYKNVTRQINENEGENEEIRWKRVGEVVKKAVYSINNKNKDYLQNFKSINKALQICLTLISRTHPRKIQRIRNHKTSEEGLYQFKLFKDGMIHNVIVDDYVPTYKGVPVFTGPANNVQVYPMLLEKAVAKISGGYSQMPKDPLQIMQMIYCGAIRRENLDDLRDIQYFKQLVTKTLQKDGLVIILAKKDKKIRQYGINDSQLYHIINHHSIKLPPNQLQHTLYQILSQNKMSAWNGCYRVTDPIWKSVDAASKQKIFKSIQNNHTFTVPDSEIHRVFEQLVVYQDTQTMNKDWLESYSQAGYPSFCRFTLKSKDQVFLRITTKQKIRQYLILCKILSEDQYELIGGDFNDNSEYLEYHAELFPGDYIICVIQDWTLKKQGEYVIYLSSTCRTALMHQNKPVQKFLTHLFTQHSSQENKQLTSTFYRSLKDIGLGYLRIFVKPPSQIKKIKINFKKILDDDWQVLEPFDDMQDIVTTSNVLIVLKMLKNKPKQLSSFPMEAFVISGQ